LPNINRFNPVRIAFHEWIDIGRDLAKARIWKGRVMAVFGNPGAIKYKEPEVTSEIAVRA
jgi:hypothetical protein